VILNDLRMPELDGPNLYQQVERDHQALCRRLIFLTGDTLSPEMQAVAEHVHSFLALYGPLRCVEGAAPSARVHTAFAKPVMCSTALFKYLHCLSRQVTGSVLSC
jgi:CheY-like chemotaxis protein